MFLCGIYKWNKIIYICLIHIYIYVLYIYMSSPLKYYFYSRRNILNYNHWLISSRETIKKMSEPCYWLTLYEYILFKDAFLLGQKHMSLIQGLFSLSCNSSFVVRTNTQFQPLKWSELARLLIENKINWLYSNSTDKL